MLWSHAAVQSREAVCRADLPSDRGIRQCDAFVPSGLGELARAGMNAILPVLDSGDVAELEHGPR